MLQVGLGLADVARPAQAEAPDGLRDRALHPGPDRAQGGELGRCFPTPRAHECDALLVRAQRQAAPPLVPGVHFARCWHAPQSELENLTSITLVPRLSRAGVQLALMAPCGQVACFRCRSTWKSAAAKPCSRPGPASPSPRHPPLRARRRDGRAARRRPRPPWDRRGTRSLGSARPAPQLPCCGGWRGRTGGWRRCGNRRPPAGQGRERQRGTARPSLAVQRDGAGFVHPFLGVVATLGDQGGQGLRFQEIAGAQHPVVPQVPGQADPLQDGGAGQQQAGALRGPAG